MKTYELLEMASLDAMGLLDQEERESFERAFRAAPPALQAQIRREQTRLATFDAVLPQVDTPPGLKSRVMAALRDAMQAVGSRSAREPVDIVGSIRPASGVSRFWRLGAVGAVAAALALAFTTFQLKRENDNIVAAANANREFDVMLRHLGPAFAEMMFKDNIQGVHLVATQPANGQQARPSAWLLVDPSAKSGRFTAQGLNSSDEYELILTDQDGKQHIAATFRGSPTPRDSRELAKISLEGVVSIALMRVGDATPLLVGTVARAS
jgi:hypothetical protein